MFGLQVQLLPIGRVSISLRQKVMVVFKKVVAEVKRFDVVQLC